MSTQHNSIKRYMGRGNDVANLYSENFQRNSTPGNPIDGGGPSYVDTRKQSKTIFDKVPIGSLKPGDIFETFGERYVFLDYFNNGFNDVSLKVLDKDVEVSYLITTEKEVDLVYRPFKEG